MPHATCISKGDMTAAYLAPGFTFLALLIRKIVRHMQIRQVSLHNCSYSYLCYKILPKRTGGPRLMV